MATTSTRTLEPTRPTSSRRKKDQQRTDIWSNLLRQTREAQARSRRQAVQSRELIICGGAPEDQRSLVERYIARPPPTQPPSRNQRDQKPRKPKGEVRLSNRFAYGYGYVTLFTPPQPSGAAGLFNAEAEEVAKVEVHTIPEAEKGYEETLRRLLKPKEEERQLDEQEDRDKVQEIDEQDSGRRASVCILMSWKEPWIFLEKLRRWLELLARALLPTAAMKGEPPLEAIKEQQLSVTVILQHTDHQELLLRESYTEESFDYISQCLRTCLLPLAAALVYVPTSLPPQQPGAPLSEVQKVLYTGLNLDVPALQAKSGKPETAPKHNVVDRMAIVVPSGWDSVGKIRLLSETFSPEAVLEGWITDLSIPLFPHIDPQPDELLPNAANGAQPSANDTELLSSAGGAEIYESSHQPSPLVASPQFTPPLSPSKAPKSAIADYERTIHDPNAHKAPKPPEIEVTTKPEQEFLAEMRAQLQQYEVQDASSQKSYHVSTTAGALNSSTSASNRGNPTGTSGAVATGEALSELGDVSFNVGGVSYNTVSAEAAIERLKRPQHPASSSPSAGDSRSGTPRPSRRDQRESAAQDGTPGSNSSKSEIPTEKLEEYFASLMRKGGGVGSQSGTPRRD